MSSVPPSPGDLTGAITKNDFLPHRIGQYGDLYRGHPSNPDSPLPKIVGIKILRGARRENKSLFAEFQKCAARWVTLEHPNVNKIYGYANDFGPSPGLIVTYHEKGNVVQYVNERRCTFNERLVLVQGIAAGLSYLHTLDPPIVHGGLRGANVFVTSGEPPRAVISDYEEVFVVDTEIFTTLHPGATVRWTAPELTAITDEQLEDEDFTEPKPNTVSDIFAFAMTMIEVFTGEPPFPTKKKETTVMRLISEGERPEIPTDVKNHPWLAQLLEQCWHQDPSARPNAVAIHDNFTSHLQQRQRPASLISNIFWYLSSFLPLGRS